MATDTKRRLTRSNADLISPARLARGLWWERAWSLVEGCTPVSPACDHCWAASQTRVRAGQQNPKMQERYSGLIGPETKQFNGQVRTMEADLTKPLHVRKPCVWAVWNDLFHEDVPFAFIAHAWAVMALCPEQVFVILTKRPERARGHFVGLWHDMTWICEWIERHDRDSALAVPANLRRRWPLPNVWLGVTAENQEQWDRRVPILLDTPAAVRLVCVEPMLGAIDARRHLGGPDNADEGGAEDRNCLRCGCVWEEDLTHECPPGFGPRPDWIICAGETGPRRRPMNIRWARSLRRQCLQARIPFWFKNNGEGVHLLDGQTWQQMPDRESTEAHHG